MPGITFSRHPGTGWARRGYAAGLDRDRRHQEEALLDAGFAHLRKALNLWWERTGSGSGSADRLAVSQGIEDCNDQLQRIKRLSR